MLIMQNYCLPLEVDLFRFSSEMLQRFSTTEILIKNIGEKDIFCYLRMYFTGCASLTEIKLIFFM